MTFRLLARLITTRLVDSVRFNPAFALRSPFPHLSQDVGRVRAATPRLRSAAPDPSLQTARPRRKFQSRRQNACRSLCRLVRMCSCHRRCGDVISYEWEWVRAYRSEERRVGKERTYGWLSNR